MICIFCKQPSDRSKSVEHIIPESLGNTEHVLPKGVVCDSCNNYFARKIEKPALESPLFLGQRARQMIPTKRRRVPELPACIFIDSSPIELGVNISDGSIGVIRESEETKLIRHIRSIKHGRLYMPLSHDIDENILARFIAKMALEILAEKALSIGCVDEVIDNDGLDLIRTFARRGTTSEQWPVHRRTIYPEGHHFTDTGDTPYQVLHEYMLLYTDTNELYAVIAILGIEYAINFGGPEIEGYEGWLHDHEGRSPLYAH